MRSTLSLALLILITPALIGAQTPVPQRSPASMSPKKLTPEEVQKSALVIDTHADTPQRFLDEHFDLGDPLKGGNWNLESARKGNLGAEFFSIWVEPKLYKDHYARRTLELIDSVKLQVARHPDQMEFVTTAAGIE